MKLIEMTCVDGSQITINSSKIILIQEFKDDGWCSIVTETMVPIFVKHNKRSIFLAIGAEVSVLESNMTGGSLDE